MQEITLELPEVYRSWRWFWTARFDRAFLEVHLTSPSVRQSAVQVLITVKSTGGLKSGVVVQECWRGLDVIEC